MKKYVFILLAILLMGCATAPIKNLELKPIVAPDLSSIKAPEIPALVEGDDFFINDKGNVEYTPSGQSKITAQVISRKLAWQQVEHLKTLLQLYVDLAQRYQDWVIEADIQRQIANQNAARAEIKAILAEIVAIFGIGVVGAVAIF